MKNTSGKGGGVQAECRRHQKKFGLCRPVPGQCVCKCFGPDRFILVIIKAGFLFIFQTLAIYCLSLGTNILFAASNQRYCFFYPIHLFIHSFIVVNFFFINIHKHLHCSNKIIMLVNDTCRTAAMPTTAPSTLGSTLEEKTRRILGWTDQYTPTVGSDYYASITSRAEKGRKHRRWNTPNPYYCPYQPRTARHDHSAKSTPLGAQLTPPPSPVVVQNGTTVYGPCTNATIGFQIPNGHVTNGQQDPIAYSPLSPSNSANGTTFEFPTPPPTVISEDTVKSPRSPAVVFELLRKRMPNLSKEPNRFRTLVDMVASVIELESQLNQLKEETRKMNGMLNNCKACWPLATDVSFEQPDKVEEPALNVVCDVQDSQFLPSESDVPDDLVGIDVTAFRSLVKENCFASPMSGESSVHVSDSFLPDDSPEFDLASGQDLPTVFGFSMDTLNTANSALNADPHFAFFDDSLNVMVPSFI
ncbi:hypothetical protein T4E_10013 [Trichinella pseudospiralis]|uniref:Uncharacterized protein n=1 Tax=Trichinella pseudospiralis TaxID=6337 RepID=A0A0V1F5K2_TRIPS|nr:hypothetical protein T4E_10013 [Trichinella pseudospiralis]KRY81351.1 hypothetical protein T4D_1120 [Trichinella pseudospiralis]KRY81352.1 hypothetical protein T4D_9895 [Trichinella pseudospiralis]